MDQLWYLGIEFTHMNVYCANKQLEAVSETYQRVLGFIEDLRDVPVDVDWVINPLSHDILYDPGPWVEGQRTHLDELLGLIRLHGSDGGRRGTGYGFIDSAAGLPKLIKDLVDPPESCPLARAAPDGAYVFNLKLKFKNLRMTIRIHRKRGFLVDF